MNDPLHRLFIDQILTVGFVDKGDDPDAAVVFFKHDHAETFAEVGNDQRVRDEIWDATHAMSQSLQSIVFAEDDEGDDRMALAETSLTQFVSAIRARLGSWLEGESTEKGRSPMHKLLKILGIKAGMKEADVEKLLAEEGANGGSTDDGAGNGGDMDFDVSKLDAKAQEAFEKLQTQLTTATGEVDELKKAADTGGGDDNKDDVLKGASPELLALLKTAQDEASAATASAEATAKVVKGLQDARENERFIKLVGSDMRYLTGAPADDFAPILRKCADALEDEEYEKLETVLKAASVSIHEGDLLKRIGSGNRAATTVDAEVQELVKALRAEDPKLDDQEARGKVFRANPTLRKQHQAEINSLNDTGA